MVAFSWKRFQTATGLTERDRDNIHTVSREAFTENLVDLGSFQLNHASNRPKLARAVTHIMNTDPFLRALPEATKLVAQEHLGRLATTWVKEKKDASSAVGKQAEAKARGSSTSGSPAPTTPIPAARSPSIEANTTNPALALQEREKSPARAELSRVTDAGDTEDYGVFALKARDPNSAASTTDDQGLGGSSNTPASSSKETTPETQRPLQAKRDIAARLSHRRRLRQARDTPVTGSKRQQSFVVQDMDGVSSDQGHASSGKGLRQQSSDIAGRLSHRRKLREAGGGEKGDFDVDD